MTKSPAVHYIRYYTTCTIIYTLQRSTLTYRKLIQFIVNTISVRSYLYATTGEEEADTGRCKGAVAFANRGRNTPPAGSRHLGRPAPGKGGSPEHGLARVGQGGPSRGRPGRNPTRPWRWIASSGFLSFNRTPSSPTPVSQGAAQWSFSVFARQRRESSAGSFSEFSEVLPPP